MADRRFDTLLYSEDDGVATVTLNRPDTYNAFNQQMLVDLRRLWTELKTDDDVRCVILTGSGDKAFCTGIDRAEAMGDGTETVTSDKGNNGKEMIGYDDPWNFDDPGDWIGPKANGLWKPVIAAVNGMACGGAFYMLGEVEFVIAAEHATFFDPHVTFGMTAAFEPIQLLHKMPFQEIMRMSLLGSSERMSAERAREVGLVSEVVSGDDLADTAAWAARQIADSPMLATMGTVRALWTGLELSRRQALDLMYLYTNVGNDPELLTEGQKRFASGQRIDWRLR
jgi:enoyl-CoA hydratase/carnithine racemase